MDIGYLRMMPNVALVSPADAVEMGGVLEFALSADRAVCVRYPKELVACERIAESSVEPFVFGKSVFARRSDKSAAVIVSYGSVLIEAIAAARALAVEGIEVDVINARFAAPIDSRIVELIGAGKPVITVEDHGVACGFGSAIMEAAGQHSGGFVPRRDGGAIRILGVPKRFVRHDSRTNQLMEAGINADKIAEAVYRILNRQQ
jgi:1-deoxy-D-xylulose-5-phosphate synthase